MLPLSSKNAILVLWVSAGVFFFGLYFSYWGPDPVLNRDDIQLIGPLAKLASLPDYVEAVKTNQILDVQPVRDLSLWVNIKIHQATGFSVFHLTNYLLFLGLLAAVSLLLQRLDFPLPVVIVVSLFFAVHPIMVSSVGWISARKHSLALLFLLLSLHSILKRRQVTVWAIFAFFLSVFSHQIFILFPAWVWTYARVKKIPLKATGFVILGFISFLAFFAGTLKTFGLSMGNVTYRDYGAFETAGRYVLSLGRMVTQILFPVSISGAYDQGNPLNLVGLGLLVFVLLAAYKNKNRRDILLWLGLGFSAHALTVITFVNDTYLYLPLITFLIAGVYLLKDAWPGVNKWMSRGFTAIALSLLLLKTISASGMWKSDLTLWEYSYRNEQSPYTAILLGSHLMKHDQKLGIEFLVTGAKNYDLVSHRPILIYFLSTILTAPLPIPEKIRILEDCYVDHEIYKSFYALALIEGSEQETHKGIEILSSTLRPLRDYEPSSEGAKIISSLRNLCRSAPHKAYVCHDLRISYQE